MIKEWILNNIEDNSIFIEAGVYDGSDTLFFSDNFKNSKIYGFEPIPSIYKKANDKIGDRDNVILYNKALSDKNGNDNIFFSDRFNSDWGSSSLLEPKEHLNIHTEITFKENIQIDCIRLDDFMEEENIDIVDFVWFDLQGYEPIILKDSLKSLKKIKYLYTEVSLIETYEGVVLYPEFKKFLIDNGFDIVFEDLPWKDMGNVLFKNKLI